ncbi:hypothetical protein K9M50_03260 [Patescibacteria group bacterium]|nr:hypothetical protein [Patescibacteria group bacterium]
MKRKTVLIVAILLIAFIGKEGKAQQNENFKVEGDIEIVYNENDDFSINDFIENHKNDPYFSHFSRKISDETFGDEIKKGDTVTMYLVSSKKPFTEAQAQEFTKKKGGQMPSLGWVLIATNQHKKEGIWNRTTVIFTEKSIKHKGYNLIPFVDNENGFYTYFRESPNEHCDFVFIKKE